MSKLQELFDCAQNGRTATRQSWREGTSDRAPYLRYTRSVATFYVENFGCRATQADGAAIERQFEGRGLARAVTPGEAELVVLNTCTVTAAADRDARAAIRRIHRQNPKAQIIVTGCYAQRAPGEVASLPGVSQVIGNSHKHRVAELWVPHSGLGIEPDPAAGFVPLAALGPPASADPLSHSVQQPTTNARRLYVSDIFAHTELLAAPVFDAANERTRPNLKIQDGCNNRCSFCVIPYVRGQSRSLPTERILEEVRTLVAAGYQEIVLSGINLGRWGRDLAGNMIFPRGRRTPRLEGLIRAILEETAIAKLRISSVEPMDWSDELIALVAASPRIARHAHVPMQSGSDRILRRMHRKYRPPHYVEKILKIHAAMPDAAIGADVMVGFPGETEADFEETRRLVEDLPFTYLHVFTYSARPGTPAASFSVQIPEPVARKRNHILRNLAARKKHSFMQSFVGKTLAAITLGRGAGTRLNTEAVAWTEALTDNYLKLRLQGIHSPNRWWNAHVTAVTDDTLVGEPLSPSVL